MGTIPHGEGSRCRLLDGRRLVVGRTGEGRWFATILPATWKGTIEDLIADDAPGFDSEAAARAACEEGVVRDVVADGAAAVEI